MTDLLNVLAFIANADEHTESCLRTLVLTLEDPVVIIYTTYYDIKKFYIFTQYRSSVRFA